MVSQETRNDVVIEDLYQQGWSIQTHYFEADLVQQLAAEAKQRYNTKQMQAAGIGRGAALNQNPAVRRDAILWLEYDSEMQQRYQSIMETLRQSLNRSLMLGLFEFEAHYAVYEAGAFYKKHYDSFQGNANRVVSTVAYLNADWPENAGGELLVYAPESEALQQSVQPEAGTLAVFLSEKIPHEVSITHQQRISIAGWFRINIPH